MGSSSPHLWRIVTCYQPAAAANEILIFLPVHICCDCGFCAGNSPPAQLSSICPKLNIGTIATLSQSSQTRPMCAVRTVQPAGSIKAIITMCSLLFCYKKLFVSDNRCHAPPWRAPPCCCSPSSSPRHLAGRWTQVSTSTQGILNIQLLFNKTVPMYLSCFQQRDGHIYCTRIELFYGHFNLRFIF